MKLLGLVFMLGILLLEVRSNSMAEFQHKAFNEIKVLANKFGRVNPKMKVAEAMDKALAGF